MSLTVSLLEESDLPGILALHRAVWKRNKEEGWFRWMYFQRKPVIAHVAKSEDKIVAFCGLVPSYVRGPEGVVHAALIQDFMATREGLKLNAAAAMFHRIKPFLVEQRASHCWGVGNRHAMNFFARAGYEITEIAPTPLMIRPCRTRGMLAKRQLPGFIAIMLDRLLRLYAKFCSMGVELEEFAGDALEAEAGWQALASKPQDYYGQVKDEAWHRWRFREYRPERYRMIKATAHNTVAWIVTSRKEDTLYIMETAGEPSVLAKALAALALGTQHAIHAWCYPHDSNYAAYRRNLFVPRNSREHCLMYGYTEKEGHPPIAQRIQDWQITLGDSDQI